MDNINSYSTIEIPIKVSNTTYAPVDTAVFHFDLSSPELQQQLVIEQMLNENRKLNDIVNEYEKTVLSAYNESNAIGNEINTIQSNITVIDKQIEELTFKIRNQQHIKTQYENKVDTLNYKLQYLQSQKHFLQTQTQTPSTTSPITRTHPFYLTSKFNDDKYSEEYVTKCLTSDILDFNTHTKIEADLKMPIIITKIIPLLQDIIINTLGYSEYKLRIFGSYATGLTLPTSELDLVIVAPSTQIVNEYNVLKRLCDKLNEMKGFECEMEEKFIWVYVVCKNEKEFNGVICNISVQDNNKHKGLQCIELIGRYVNMYPILEPVIIVVKQILKYGNVLSYYVSK